MHGSVGTLNSSFVTVQDIPCYSFKLPVSVMQVQLVQCFSFAVVVHYAIAVVDSCFMRVSKK